MKISDDRVGHFAVRSGGANKRRTAHIEPKRSGSQTLGEIHSAPGTAYAGFRRDPVGSEVWMSKRAKATCPEVSVILAVRDAEESVGRDVRRLADRLRSLAVPFEIVAVNDGSYDTSFALLGLLAKEIPELCVLPRDAAGRAFARGLAESRAATVLFLEAGRSPPPLAPLGWILSRLQTHTEAVVVRGRCIAARRSSSLPVVARVRGRGAAFERAFEREARDLRVDVIGTSPRPSVAGWLSPVLRFLAV